MKFEDIKKRFDSGKQTKIHIVETKKPLYLFTGYVADTASIDKGNYIDLKPYVSFNVRQNGMGGTLLDKEGSITLDIRDAHWQHITSFYTMHECRSKALVRQVCGKETEMLEKYLNAAEELYCLNSFVMMFS